MYAWRKLSKQERQDLLAQRKARGMPWHSPPHLDLEGERTYIFSAACYEHKPVLTLHADRLQECQDQILLISYTWCDTIHAWCFLPNHYHLLVTTDRIRPFRKEIGLFHGRSSRKWNLQDHQEGRHVWCNYMERPIQAVGHLGAAINYLHNNPVRHDLVSRWQDWPYSSVHVFLETYGREEAERLWKRYPPMDFGKGWDW
jgi:putative transposase